MHGEDVVVIIARMVEHEAYDDIVRPSSSGASVNQPLVLVSSGELAASTSASSVASIKGRFIGVAGNGTPTGAGFCGGNAAKASTSLISSVVEARVAEPSTLSDMVAVEREHDLARDLRLSAIAADADEVLDALVENVEPVGEGRARYVPRLWMDRLSSPAVVMGGNRGMEDVEWL